MPGYALYRLPMENRANVLVQAHGDLEILGGYDEMDGRSGFIMAPFTISTDTPLLLIRPDHTASIPQEKESAIRELVKPAESFFRSRPEDEDEGEELQRDLYGREFRVFHKALLENSFRKLVLARRLYVKSRPKSPFKLFTRACILYPRMFVSLVSTPQSGTWLTATPEVLLSVGKNNPWRTMALAGTMKLEGRDALPCNPANDNMQDIRWSQKNIQEQRYVATYISECLKTCADDICEEGPYTVRAANLVHLRSDFSFSLKNGRTGTLAGKLHPTPAVCGIPKDKAKKFIINNETSPRSYYSGFTGPLSQDGHSHLFVSLRCMEICDNGYELYAGGGILKESDEQTEWKETEAKMETMKRLIYESEE